jgi:16S rRNA (cytosine967-C5)-methyltransferase
VPCSNTGVIRRRPDARWRFSKERLAELLRTQEALLNHASTLLKPGGTLIYSTCSLEREEDEQMIANWLKNHPAFTLKHEKKLVPPESGTDGAYVAPIISGA